MNIHVATTELTNEPHMIILYDTSWSLSLFFADNAALATFADCLATGETIPADVADPSRVRIARGQQRDGGLLITQSHESTTGLTNVQSTFRLSVEDTHRLATKVRTYLGTEAAA